ncbi:hypothetical protein YC2023_058351 [Brassica napus]
MVWCVPMDPSTTAAGCGFEHAVGLELKLSGWLASAPLVGYVELGGYRSSFSWSVLDEYEHVAVLMSLTVTVIVRLWSTEVVAFLPQIGILYRCFDAIDEVFSGGQLSLRVDSSGSRAMGLRLW